MFCVLYFSERYDHIPTWYMSYTTIRKKIEGDHNLSEKVIIKKASFPFVYMYMRFKHEAKKNRSTFAKLSEASH